MRASLLLLAVVLSSCAHIDYAERARSPLPEMRIAHKKASDFDVPPKLIEGTRPGYPGLEGGRRESGFVVIICTIGTDGHAGDFAIESMTNPAFAFAAVQAIAKWKWSPALKHGQPIAQKVRVPMTFRA